MSRASMCAALLFTLVGSLAVRAEVCLPKVFGDHMVLQQGRPIQVWGWANSGETVSVRLNNGRATATANAQGEWKTSLPAQFVGGPFELVISGSSTQKFADVFIGEVWLCSGQSNMEMGIKNCTDAEKEIAAADHPKIRLLTVPNRWSPLPETNIESAWKVCSLKTIAEAGWGGFSACAYYFGRKLHQELGVPIGLIDATWGGTGIQSWMPPEGFASSAALKKEYEKVLLADPRTAEHREQHAGSIITLRCKRYERSTEHSHDDAR